MSQPRFDALMPGIKTPEVDKVGVLTELQYDRRTLHNGQRLSGQLPAIDAHGSLPPREPVNQVVVPIEYGEICLKE